MDCSYCPLDAEALLHLSGPDGLTFLQGQTSCDTRDINETQAAPGIYCTPQGRVVCDFLLTQLADEHYVLRMRADIVANSAAVFGKYIVFSKAELDGARDDWQALALWGKDAAQLLTTMELEAPGARYACSASEHMVAVQIDSKGEQFECYVNPQQGSRQLTALQEQATRQPESDWQLLQLHSAVPRIEQATVEQFVPQTLNYDLTGYISFSKGCYTGQEVVARLHYRGKPKRRTYLAQLPEGSSAKVGDALYSEAASGSSGDIVNLAGNDEASFALVSATEQGVAAGLHMISAQGPALTLLELPYALSTDD